jgi:hypothetical protein
MSKQFYFLASHAWNRRSMNRMSDVGDLTVSARPGNSPASSFDIDDEKNDVVGPTT